MKTFKQYFEEKTFGLDKDVQIVYNRLFKELVKNILKNAGMAVEETINEFPSEELMSPSSRKANTINPVTIVGGLDFGDYSNYYKPNRRVIHLSIHPGAAKLLQQNRGMSIQEVADILPEEQRNNFIGEFSPNRIRSSIQHELSHWIDDTLHGSHIKSMIDKLYDAKTRKEAEKIQRRGAPNSETSDYEINAQIHAIKQLRKANRRIWDQMSVMDLLRMHSPLNVIYKKLDETGKQYWIKKLLHRMSRENILGKNMKYTG